MVLLLACHGVIPRFELRPVRRHRLGTPTGLCPAEPVAPLRPEAWDPGAHRLRRRHPPRRARPTPPVRLHAAACDPPSRGKDMARRQCTHEYKIRPLKATARQLLGYPTPAASPTESSPTRPSGSAPMRATAPKTPTSATSATSSPSSTSATPTTTARPTWQNTDSAPSSSPLVSAARSAAMHDGAGCATTTPTIGPTPSPSTTPSATAVPVPWPPASRCVASTTSTDPAYPSTRSTSAHPPVEATSGSSTVTKTPTPTAAHPGPADPAPPSTTSTPHKPTTPHFPAMAPDSHGTSPTSATTTPPAPAPQPLDRSSADQEAV